MNPYGPAIDQLRPYKGTVSGEREHQKPSYNNGPPSTKYPILALEDNIADDEGRGLKKGFYEIRISENKDFLLLQHRIWRSAEHPYLSGMYRYAGFSSSAEQKGSGICDGSGPCHKLSDYPSLQI